MNYRNLLLFFLASFNFVYTSAWSKTKNDVAARYGFGEKIKLMHYPFFGFFSLFTAPDKPPICSGAIIHEKWVLTSARCIRNISNYVTDIIFTTHAVDSSFNTKQSFWNHLRPNVQIIHNGFQVVPGKGEHSVHDIGLARLSTALHFSKYVHPIDLAVDNSESYTYEYGTFVEFASYPDERLLVPMEIASAKLCILGQHECIAKTLNMVIDDSLHVCGFDREEHVRACQSDDGAPFVLNDKLIGIATVTTPGCVNEWRPTVFTRVSAHVPWIREKLRQYGDL